MVVVVFTSLSPSFSSVAKLASDQLGKLTNSLVMMTLGVIFLFRSKRPRRGEQQNSQPQSILGGVVFTCDTCELTFAVSKCLAVLITEFSLNERETADSP